MGLFSRFFGSPSASSRTSGTAEPEGWLLNLFGGMMTDTGIVITPALAKTVPGIAACQHVLAEDFSKVPCILHRKLRGGGSSHADDHPLYRLLKTAPMPWLSSYAWRNAKIRAALSHGNAFSRAYRDERGELTGIRPLKPGQTGMRWTDQGEPFFDLAGSWGSARGLTYQQVIHLAYRPSMDGAVDGGVLGESPIATHAGTIALAVATERFAAMYFRKGARPSVAVEMEQAIPDEETAKRMRRSLEDAYAGLDNMHRIAILELGAKLKTISASNHESQLVELRKDQAIQCCQIYNVPPHKIGILDRATFSNIEHQAIEFVTGPLSALAEAFESSVEIACLTATEREDLFVKLNLEGLLRGDILSRYRAYAIGRQWGWLSADDVCEMEDRNPLPGGAGKTYFVPLNMAPAGDDPMKDDPPQKSGLSSLVGADGRPLLLTANK